MKAILTVLAVILSVIVYLGGMFIIVEGAFMLGKAWGLIALGAVMLVLSYGVLDLLNALEGGD